MSIGNGSMREGRASRARAAANERFLQAVKMSPMTGLAERLAPPESVPYPGAHLGLRWRPIIASDAAGVAHLFREVENHDRAIHRTSAAEIADMIEGHGRYDVVDTVVGLDAEGHPTAVATVRVHAGVPDMAVAVVNAFIAPHWRGRGLGRALLYWQDGRARQMLMEIYGKDSLVPAMVMNLVDSHMTDRRRLYIAAGFYARRTFQVMYREIEGSEEPIPPRGDYRIVPWSQIPIDALHALHLEVFTDHFWPQMSQVWWDEALDELDIRWSFVALDAEGAPVGYAAVGRPVDRWIAEGRTEAYVSLLGVARDHRGGGLTSALLASVVAAVATSGVSRVGLDVDTAGASNAHAIYEHLGFVDERSIVYYTIDH